MKNDHPQIKELEYNHITDGIYIGTNACCQLHMDQELLSKGIEADISLEEERVDHPFGVEFYLWLPTPDHMPPNQEQLQLGVNTLRDLVKFRKKVYVHCQNGHGRAPTLVAAYLIKQGKQVEEAIDLIKTKRPTIHLEEVQKNALTKFQRILKRNV